VAEAQSLAKRIGLTPGKGAVIGVLAVVLVGVIYVQYGSSGEATLVVDAGPAEAIVPAAQAEEQALPATPPPTAEVPEATAPAPAAQEQNAVTADAVTAEFDESKWKSPELTMVVAYDPFALPSAFPQPVRTADGGQVVDGGDVSGADAEAAAAKLAEAIESLQSELRALQERGVHVIINGRDQYVAMIGDRTVHVGDEINGFTVTAIEADGVRVERKLDE
jgi:hypothetical protein